MCRIVLLVTVALVMATMLALMALPAFAVGPAIGECERGIAQVDNAEIKGTKGEAIRSTCLLIK